MYFIYLFLLILNISWAKASPDDLPWSYETYFRVSRLSQTAAKDIEGKPPKNEESKKLESTIKTMGAGFLPDGQPLAIEMLGDTDKITQCIDDHLNPTTAKTQFEENLEVFTIPQDDPRFALRGQRGVRAKRDFNDFTLLGIYSSHVYHFYWHGATLNNFRELMENRTKTLDPDSQTRETVEEDIRKRIKTSKLRKMAGPQDCIRYFEHELSENNSQGHRYRYDLDYGKHRFVFAPLKQLSPMHLINAPEAGQKANVGYAVLKLTDRFPLLVVLTEKKIEAGTELLADYAPDDDALNRINGDAPDNDQALYALRHNWRQINDRLQPNVHIPIEPTAQENQLTDWQDLWLTKKRTRL